MLVGVLPWDNDPLNPDGDNINLLSKYILSTPLAVPAHVTTDARDLLERILVPNPRLRADMDEIARHSWLSEHSHIVDFLFRKPENSPGSGERGALGDISTSDESLEKMKRPA
jgi:protein-serine/threonine kinase